jgi:ATP:ADP antiporter, AAA family
VKPRFREHPIEFGLALFGDVRPGEGGTVLLLTANLFLLLTAYYLLKVAREPLILLGGGAEVKSYASVAQSILLVFAVNGYSWLAARMSPMTLVMGVTAFFASNLLVFWVLGSRAVPLGVPFFLWVGLFNLIVITQFWSLAADTYTEEQGKRLFPIIGIGSSMGAVSGSALAGPIVQRASPFALMLVGAAVLVSSLAVTWAVHRRNGPRSRAQPDKAARDMPMAKGNAFAMVLQDRYLLLLAALIFVLNTITKTGDYVLDRMLIVEAHTNAAALGITPTAFIGHFKARYFEWINVLEVVLQSFFVSRIIKYAGLRTALVLVPLASLSGYGAALAVPSLGVLFVTRVTESTLDYSLSSTARQALWLVTSREAKYKAKQVVDAVAWRAGDMLSAGAVWVGSLVSAGPRAFIAVNVVCAAGWAAIAYLAGRAYERRARPIDAAKRDLPLAATTSRAAAPAARAR